MTRRPWPAVALLLACAALLAVLWPREREPMAAVPSNAAPQPEVAPIEIAAPQPAAERAVAEVELPPAAADEALPIEAAPAARPQLQELELRGRLIVLDAAGLERATARASFEVIAWRGRGGSNAEVEVVDGLWSAHLSARGPITHLSFEEFVVDGSRATLEAPVGDVALPPEGWLDLRVRLPQRVVLRVLDAATGAHLAGVMLARTEPFPRDGDVHPGLDIEKRTAARDLRSPIELEQVLGAVELRRFAGLLVGCEGYAWARVALDVEHGGERVVALERGGVLDLRVIGAAALPQTQRPGETTVRFDAPSRVELRLHRDGPGTKPILSADLDRREAIELAGLAPGRYWVQAEVGEWWSKPAVLGSVEVEIVAGSRCEATLVVEAPPQIKGVRVSGRAWVPTEWECDNVLLALKLLDTPLLGFERYQRARGERQDSERDGFERFDWSFARVQPGRYELGLHKPPFLVGIEVSAEHAEFELVVPPPVEVSVRVVDDATGADVEVEAVMWHPTRPRDSGGGGVESVRRDASTGRYEFRAPATSLRMWTQDPRYSMVCEPSPESQRTVVSSGSDGWTSVPGWDTLTVSGTRVEHTLRVRPTCGFVLRLKDGDTLVPFPPDWQGSPQALGGAGTSTGLRTDLLSRRYTVSEPGVYTLELPRIAAYAPIPMQTATVVAGEFVEHVIELVRETP